jgi:SAM-dependent methyltransferase
MHPDIAVFYDWYASPLGRVARQILGGHLKKCWPEVGAEQVLMVGFGAPYGHLWRKPNVVWAMPAAMGGVKWPEKANRGGRSLMVWERTLPFREATFDRILLIHELEFAEGPRQVLEECWRVLAPAGRLLVIAPNRLGGWARTETSPFAQGNPYSRAQLRRLLDQAGFHVRAVEGALYMPPIAWEPFLRASKGFENIGRWTMPAVSGVVVAQAHKDVLGGKAVRASRQGRPMVAPVLIPVTKARTN